MTDRSRAGTGTARTGGAQRPPAPRQRVGTPSSHHRAPAAREER